MVSTACRQVRRDRPGSTGRGRPTNRRLEVSAMSTVSLSSPVSPAVEGWVAPTWEQVVREHTPRVYRLAYRLSGNPQDAEDLTQETFIRVFRSLADFRPGTFEGWLHRLTTNL